MKKQVVTKDQQSNLLKAKFICNVLSHPLRTSMLDMMMEADASGGLNVTTIYVKLKIPQSVASLQLGLLRKANVVTCKKVGKERMYSVNKTRIADITSLCMHF